jgi:D-amino peptidase
VAACREIEDLIPGVITAAVKEGMARQSAISLSREASHRLIRQRVMKAVSKQRSEPISPLVWEGPFELEKRYLFTEGADGAMRDPRAVRVDSKTVRLRADDILDIIYA